MTVTVSPTELNPTHHIKLTGGSTDVGLVLVGPDASGKYIPNARAFTRNPASGAVKIAQGESTYADTPEPWSEQVQSDWSGGMGSEVFDDDKARYYIGKRAYTGQQAFEIGPQPVWTSRYIGYKFWPHHRGDGTGLTYTWHPLTKAYPAIAVSFTTTATTPVTRYHFVMRLTGTYYTATQSGGNYPAIIASLFTDSAGAPGAGVADTDGIFYPSLAKFGESQEVIIDVTGTNLSASTKYWLVLDAQFPPLSDLYATPEILCATQSSTSFLFYVTSGSSWTAQTLYKPFFRAMAAASQNKAHYFELKGALHKAVQFNNGAQSKLYINGDCGVASSGTTTTIVSAAAGHKVTWTDNALIGSVVVLTSGTGSTQPRNFRTITGNATSGGDLTITCSSSDPWDVAPAANTEWAVVANNTWTALTEPDAAIWLNNVVTDVLVANGAAYFAHGDAYAMTRLMIYNNAGTWTYDMTQESTTSVEAYATKLALANDAEGAFIWKGRGGFPSKIAKAPVVDCTGATTAADLVFKAEIYAGDYGSRITNMLQYGEYGNLHVIKEGDIYQVINSSGTDYIYKIPISAMPNTKDWRNGRAACLHNSYLFFSWQDTVLRYLNNYLDNVGPNSSDTVTPSDMRGVITKMVSYPGMLYACVDGGTANYSSVIAYNGTGWFNLFTSPIVGMQIQNIYIQPVPGDNVDRLWISCGPESVWIPISTNPFHHAQVAYNFYCTAWDATIEMGNIYCGKRRVYKYFNAMKFDGDNLYTVYLSDPVSNTPEGVWTTGDKTISLLNTALMNRPRIIMYAQSNATPVRVTSVVVEAIMIEETNWVDTLTFRVADRDKDLNGDFDDYQDHNLKLAQLDTWANTPTALTMRSVIKQLDNKTVFIEEGGMRLHHIVTDDGQQAYLCQLQVYEVS